MIKLNEYGDKEECKEIKKKSENKYTMQMEQTKTVSTCISFRFISICWISSPLSSQMPWKIPNHS